MWTRPLAAVLAITLAACSDKPRYPVADGGIPSGHDGGGAGGAGGGPVTSVTAGPIISENPLANWESEAHLAVAADGRIFAVWIDLQLGSGRFVGYARSADGGATWSAPGVVPSDPGNAAVDPSVTTDDQGTFHVAWLEQIPGGGRRVMTAAYDDGADVFSVPEELSDPVAATAWDKPWIVNTGEGLLVVWGSDTGSSLYAARSADGAWWQTSTFAPNGTLRNVVYACPAGGGRVYLTYLVPGGVEVARSDDGGATWGVPARADAEEMVAFEAPSCAAEGDSVWVLYGASPDVTTAEETPLLTAVRVARSADGGVTFQGQQSVGETAGVRSLLPVISRAPGGRLDVVYYAGSQAGDPHGLFRWVRSSDGVSWGDPVTVQGPVTLEVDRDGFGWLGDYVGVRSGDDGVYVVFADNGSVPGALLSHVRFGRVSAP